MQPEIIATYMDISTEDAKRLLALPPADVYADSAYQGVINRLDAEYLRRTLTHVRAAYAVGLDPIKEKYGLTDTIMSGFTLGNWVLGFLTDPDHLNDMLDRHARIAPDIIADALPELVDLLEDIPEGRAEWQRALVAFSLPMIAQG